MLIQICNRHAHILKIIARDVGGFVYIYGVIIIIFGIVCLVTVIMLIKHQFFVAFLQIQVGKPMAVSKFHRTCFFIIYTFCILPRIIDIKESVAAGKSVSKPHFIIFNQRENLFVSNCILVSNNQKFLFVFDK